MAPAEDEVAIREASSSAAAALWPSVVQLFTEDGPVKGGETIPRPEPVGSGVLVEIGSELFLFTAAHILAHFKDRHIHVGAAGSTTLMLLAGKGCHTGTPEMGNHDTDPLDAAVLWLYPEHRSSLIHLATLQQSLDPFPSANEHYLLLGYPGSRQRTQISNRRNLGIATERLPRVCHEAPAQDYQVFEKLPEQHLLLKWQSKWTNHKGSHWAHDLHGASGGGIWKWNPAATGDRPLLVATFTEIPAKKGRRVLVGTRIRRHLELTMRLCPRTVDTVCGLLHLG